VKHFTIDTENNITFHASRNAARETGSGVFSTEEQFADLIGNDNQRLLDIWNSLPGVKPVAKFENRKKATERIWRAIQSLGGASAQEPAPQQEPSVAPGEAAQATPFDEPVATVGAQAPDVASVKGKANKKATRTKKTPVAAPNATAPREGSKTSRVIAMLKREGGATLEEIMSAMAWQQHTTRALMSAGGALAKKHGLIVSSEKVGDQRTYFIKA
jgi:Protein of unknown function (DUF3489)